MSDFFGFCFALWFIGALLSYFPFWLKKTDRSQHWFQRRLVAIGYACVWPYHVYRYFAGKQERERQADGLERERRDILGGGSAAPSSEPGSGPRMRNPFDNA